MTRVRITPSGPVLNNGEPFLLMKFPDMGREVWAKWDEGAMVYELFASEACDDYLGCADTVEEARTAARQIADEWMSS